MPTNYQFQPLPLANEEVFDNFIMELFNELYPNSEYQTYGRRGERQNGIDIICYEDNTVIQCKKKELAHTTTSIRKLKETIKSEFRADLEAAVNCDDFQFDNFIFATTFPTDTDLQNLASSLSKEFKKTVTYCGWGVITQKLHDCPNTLRKYYDSLVLESKRVSDLKFKDSVRNKHIIDQCYESLLRFDGLKFIDPKIIAGIFPFKVDNQRSYPRYNRFCLATNNDALTELFTLISVDKTDNYFKIKKGKKNIVKKKCPDADYKLKYIQEVLDSCLIHCIKTTDEKHNKIPGVRSKNCECSGCLSEELRFTDLILSLKTQPDTLDRIFGYYKLHDFEKASSSLKNCIKKELNPINLALERYDEYWLSILSSNERVSKYEFYSKIRSVEFDNEPVQEAIIDLEQDRILSRAHEKIDSIVDDIRRIYEGYATRKLTTNGPDYATQLTVETMIVYSHFRHNCLVKDIYNDYQNLFRKALSGWLFSTNTSSKYIGRLKNLQIFHIAMSVYYNSGKDLIAIFRETNTRELNLSDNASDYLKKIAINYFGQFNDGNTVYGEYVKNSFSLSGSHRSLFQALLINLAYSNIQECPPNLCNNINTFIQNENFLYTYDLKYLGILFEKKGIWFTPEEHISILNTHLSSNNSKSYEMIYRILYSFHENCTDLQITDTVIINKIIGMEETSLNHYAAIDYLRKIVSVENLVVLDKKLLLSLQKKFDSFLYRVILVGDQCPMQDDDALFKSYVEYVNEKKGITVGADENGFEIIYGYEFINFISGILYSQKRTLDDPIILNGLSDLSNYQKWLLNPETFDYDHFKIEWIQLSDNEIILKHLGKSHKLKSIIADELNIHFDKLLSENFAKMML